MGSAVLGFSALGRPRNGARAAGVARGAAGAPGSPHARAAAPPGRQRAARVVAPPPLGLVRGGRRLGRPRRRQRSVGRPRRSAQRIFCGRPGQQQQHRQRPRQRHRERQQRQWWRPPRVGLLWRQPGERGESAGVARGGAGQGVARRAGRARRRPRGPRHAHLQVYYIRGTTRTTSASFPTVSLGNARSLFAFGSLSFFFFSFDCRVSFFSNHVSLSLSLFSLSSLFLRPAFS